MKSYKLLFLATLAFATNLSFAQNVKGKKVSNLGIISEPKQLLTEPQVPLMLRQEQGLGTTLPDFHTDVVTAQRIGSSANYYTYSNNGQKQIGVLNDLNAVSFVFRNNPNVTGAGNSGHLRYNVSSDGGITWAVPFTGAGIGNLNPTQTSLARFPDAFLFADPSEITAATTRLGIISTTINNTGSAFNGFLQSVVSPDIFTNILSPIIEQETYTTSPAMFEQHITERISGEFWATMYGDMATNDTIYVMKGAYNSVLQKIEWICNDKLKPNWNLAIDDNEHWSMPKIEFSPNGNVGYVAVLGDLVGGQDSAYVPILWEFNPVTSHFTGGNEIPINQFPEFTTYISSFIDSTTGLQISNGLPACGFNFDLSVDAYGNPHIMTIVGPSSSGVLSSPMAYAFSSGFALQVMDITKDYTGSWNMIKLANQHAFRETLTGSSVTTTLDPSMHLSRSADGEYIFYTWSDSDSAANPMNLENTQPNLKGCFYSVATQMLSPVIDWTYDDNIWANMARAPKTASRVLETSGTGCPGRSFTVPTTVALMSAYPDPAMVTDFFYLSNISYNCSDATIAARMFHTCAMTPISLSANTVTASNGQNNGSITLTTTGGLGSYTYQILNPAGNVVATTSSATGLPSGTYTVMVADSYGCADTLMLAMNSLSISGNLANIRSFKAYPNPASSVLNIQMTLATAEDIEISLVNTAGQTILSKKIEKAATLNETFDVANLAKGIYFLKVNNAQGSAAEKIVIE